MGDKCPGGTADLQCVHGRESKRFRAVHVSYRIRCELTQDTTPDFVEHNGRIRRTFKVWHKSPLPIRMAFVGRVTSLSISPGSILRIRRCILKHDGPMGRIKDGQWSWRMGEERGGRKKERGS